MKQIRFLVFVVSIILVNSLTAYGLWNNSVTKEKKVIRHYNVQSGDVLAINNQYGKVHINTWDKNEINVEVKIEVTARNEDVAQDRLDGITIDEDGANGKGHEITLTTQFANLKFLTSMNFKIEYTVYMPRKNGLKITNKYGNVYLGDFDGKLDLNMSYGALKTQNLAGPLKDIKVSFGSVDVASVDLGDFTTSYSGVNIEQAGKLNVINKFGKFAINHVNDLDIRQSYGELEIGTAGKVEGDVNFAGVTIDRLTKSMNMRLKYCTKTTLGSVGAGVEKVEMDISYGALACKFDDGANLALEISTSYSSLKNQVALRPFEFGTTLTESGTNSALYHGKLGAGKGTFDIHIKYGSITLK